MRFSWPNAKAARARLRQRLGAMKLEAELRHKSEDIDNRVLLRSLLKTVRVEPFLLTNEIVEKALIDELRLHYPHAHQIAVRAERDAVCQITLVVNYCAASRQVAHDAWTTASSLSDF
jgi:hypothetical protein